MRRGLIHVARMDAKEGLADMHKASEVDPTNGDVYQHRGQVGNLFNLHLDPSLPTTIIFRHIN